LRPGNIAYDSMDIGLSVYGLNRLVLRPDAWRLFRYVRTDYVRAYRTMTPKALILEWHIIHQTGKQVHKEAKKKIVGWFFLQHPHL